MNSFGRNCAALVLAAACLFSHPASAAPANTAFTYQGRLNSGADPASGVYDFKFALFDARAAGSQVGAAVTNQYVIVDKGLFSTAIDFGAAAFNGDPRWLEISVRSGNDGFSVLSPRQQIAATPYAITALSLNPAAIATNSPWIATTNWVSVQGFQPTNGLTRKAVASPLPYNGTNYVVDFGSEITQLIATNNINLQSSTNRVAPGWYGEAVWYIQGGPTNQLLSWNTNWITAGALAMSMPFIVASNKLTLIALSVRGDSETNVTYAISRQE